MSSQAPNAAAIEQGVRRALERELEAPFNLHVEYRDILDAARTPYLNRVLDLLRAKYQDIPIDVLIAHRTEALGLALEHRSVFHDPPVAFVEISRDRAASFMALSDKLTGTVIEYDLPSILAEARSLVPKARRAVIVGGASAFDRGFEDTFRQALESGRSPLRVESLIGLPLEDQLAQVAALPGDAVVFVPSYRADPANRLYRSDDVVARIAETASVPTFGFAESWLGLGVVGGSLVRFDVQGERAGTIAAQLLRGQPASSIPFVGGPVTTRRFDARALSRWGIPESRLPPGSEVLFREPSLWNDNKWTIVAGLAILLAQSGLILALTEERRRRHQSQAAEADAEARYRTVANSTADWVYWLSPDGSFQYVSPSSLRVTGHPADAFIENPGLLREIVVEEDRRAWNLFRGMERTSEAPLSTEVRIRSREGATRWLEIAEAAIFAPDGVYLGVQGSARDITDRKRTERDLRSALSEIEQLRDRLELDNTLLRQEVARESGIDGLLGTSDVMSYVVTKVRQVAPTSSTVLLLGETGVGKSHLARAIHDLSSRRGRPFVTLDCAALPPSLIEPELFGHERGAFTGAHSRRIGRFEAASGSTLFLDEIGELPLDLQAKLLRAVQDGEFERVGSSVPIRTDVRLIAATNTNLEAQVRAGRFRQDLWYRLNVFPLSVPPLRQRSGDIPLLVMHLIEKHCHKLGRPVMEVTRADMKWLQAQPWPGNVRELEAFIERSVIQSPGTRLDISAGPIPGDTQTAMSGTNGAGAEWLTLEDMERGHILATLERVGWRISGSGGAADVLRINPSTLRSRMERLGISRQGQLAR